LLRRRFVTETFYYGDVLLRSRFITEKFCYGDVLFVCLRRVFSYATRPYLLYSSYSYSMHSCSTIIRSVSVEQLLYTRVEICVLKCRAFLDFKQKQCR
jgi:hypothetical protein